MHKNTRHNATKVSTRGTRPGSIRQLRLRLWWAISEASALLDDPETDVKLKAISAMSTAAGVYGNLTKLHALESEVENLEKQLHDVRAALSSTTRTGHGGTAAPLN